ncbi:MAG: GspH/FimT family pseudopilin [Acidobacteria bacterium]|nr:GspH/FimT family pseudopilin [Acidobacteriota bacterium]
MGDRRAGCQPADGFTLLELMLVLGIGAVLIGAAIPAINGARQRLELSGAIHDVAAAVQSARLQALSSGRTMRVRFNCPVAGQYRVVEIVGNATIDNAANRCDPAAYPYPDQNANARPDLDGPVRGLRGGVSFSQATNVDIAPTGRITPVTGAAPVSITVVKSDATQTLTLSAAGRVSFQ